MYGYLLEQLVSDLYLQAVVEQSAKQLAVVLQGSKRVLLWGHRNSTDIVLQCIGSVCTYGCEVKVVVDMLGHVLVVALCFAHKLVTPFLGLARYLWQCSQS